MKLAPIFSFHVYAEYSLILVFTVSEETSGGKRVPYFRGYQLNISKTAEVRVELEDFRV